MDKFQNKYRIPSARLQSWDYGANGAYFITICTKYMIHYFGEIVQTPYTGGSEIETPKLGKNSNETPKLGKNSNETPKLGKNSNETPKLGVSTMQLNEIGKLAEKFWMEIPEHYPFIELGNFVAMPNHFHGILIINKSDADAVQTPYTGVSDNTKTPIIQRPKLGVPNTETPNLGVSTAGTGGKNEKWKSNTIGSIVNQYKRILTINARKINPNFNWQSRFFDNIIWNSKSFENIQNYIANNPENWKNDKFNDKK